MEIDLNKVWNLIDMARGLIDRGVAHDILAEAQTEISMALSKQNGEETK